MRLAPLGSHLTYVEVHPSRDADLDSYTGYTTEETNSFLLFPQMGVSENRLVPLHPMVLLIIIPMKNG